MDDLSRFYCLNPECPAYGQHGRDNLHVAFRYGPRNDAGCWPAGPA